MGSALPSDWERVVQADRQGVALILELAEYLKFLAPMPSYRTVVAGLKAELAAFRCEVRECWVCSTVAEERIPTSFAAFPTAQVTSSSGSAPRLSCSSTTRTLRRGLAWHAADGASLLVGVRP